MQKGLLDIQLNNSRIRTEPELALITANSGQNKLCYITLLYKLLRTRWGMHSTLLLKVRRGIYTQM